MEGEACCYWHWCKGVVQAVLSRLTTHKPPQHAAPMGLSHSHVPHSVQSACCHLWTHKEVQCYSNQHINDR
jgi:hypothetical protein